MNAIISAIPRSSAGSTKALVKLEPGDAKVLRRVPGGLPSCKGWWLLDKIFGVEQNRDVLISLLNAIESEEDEIDEIEINRLRGS